MTISNTREIGGFLHCGLCLKEKASSVSAKEYARLEVGWTKAGLQVWCVRHDVNVIHLDFEGQKHPANTTARSKEGEGETRH